MMKPLQSEVRMARGEFWKARHQARAVFFKQLTTRAPDKVSELLKLSARHARTLRLLRGGDDLSPTGNHGDELRPLLDWCRKTHLDAPWVKRRVILSAARWARKKQFRGPAEWRNPTFRDGGELVPASQRRIIVIARIDDPGSVSRGAALKKFIAIATDRFNETWSEICESAPIQDRGVSLTAIRDLNRFLDWIIDYQVHEMSYQDVAARHGLANESGRRTVARGVQAVSDLIGLPLRAPRRGGPRPRSGPAQIVRASRPIRR
jgi:hypothetical protein